MKKSLLYALLLIERGVKVNYPTQQEDRASAKVQTQEEVYICRVQDKEVGLRMPWKSNRHRRGNTMKIEVRGDYSTPQWMKIFFSRIIFYVKWLYSV